MNRAAKIKGVEKLEERFEKGATKRNVSKYVKCAAKAEERNGKRRQNITHIRVNARK